jgi:hypothetical protein
VQKEHYESGNAAICFLDTLLPFLQLPKQDLFATNDNKNPTPQ